MNNDQRGVSRRIGLVSQRFAKACTWLIGIVLLGSALYWFLVDPVTLSSEFLNSVVPVYSLIPALRLACLALTLMAAIPLILGLSHLRRLFLLYAAGVMFGEKNVTALRGLGNALLLFSIAQVLFVPVLALVLSASNPAGERVVSVGISSGIVIAAAAVVVLVVGGGAGDYLGHG